MTVLRYYSFKPWAQWADIYGNKLYIQKYRSKSANQALTWALFDDGIGNKMDVITSLSANHQ